MLLVAAIAVAPWPRTEAFPAPTTARLGDAFLREYLLPFELVSLVLLMALVGAMVIARRAVRDAAARPRGDGAVEGAAVDVGLAGAPAGLREGGALGHGEGTA